MVKLPDVGDILWLERSIAGLPYPAGYWVLCRVNSASVYVALVGANEQGERCAIDNWYLISVEDLGAFTKTGDKALVLEPSAEGLQQDSDLDDTRRN